jgi:nitrogen fixation protein NifU and related proteins
MFSDAVLDHFRSPRNAGELNDATVSVEVSNPVCGDVLRLATRIEHGQITEARFLCQGCATAIACASLLTEELRGKPIFEARRIDAQYLSDALGGLPAATRHAADLATEALRELFNKA